MTALTGKLADPEFRRQRAITAARARHSLSAQIAAIERDINQLTPDEVNRLHQIVRTARLRTIKRQGEVKQKIVQCEGQRTIDDHFHENGVHV